MIRILLSERIRKTAETLPSEIRAKANEVIRDVANVFGDPRRHRGLGLRKLARRSYEARLHLRCRLVFLHEGSDLVAYDIMTHDKIARWLRGQRKYGIRGCGEYAA